MDPSSIDVATVAGWLVGGGAVLILAATARYGVSVYNDLVALRHNVRKAWADVDVLLVQRHDELPKVVSAVQGYLHHEHDVLTRVTEARRQFDAAHRPDASVEEVVHAAGVTGAALARLLAVAEQYPDLKADTSVQTLLRRITDLERQLADRREYFNHRVNIYNVRIDQLPALLIAHPFGFTPETLFEVVDPAKLEDVEIGFQRS